MLYSLHCIANVCNIAGKVVTQLSKSSNLTKKPPMELPDRKALVLLSGVVPIVVSLLWAVFNFYSFEEWNWEKVFYFGARDVGRTFLVWEKGMMEVANNKTEELLFIYTPDTVWIVLGIVQMIGAAADYLQHSSLHWIMLACAMSLFKHTSPMGTAFKLLGNELARGLVNCEVPHNSERYEKTWKYYFHVRRTSKNMNKVMGGVVISNHITNVLRLLAFLVVAVLNDLTVLTCCIFLCDIAHILAFYILATRINQAVCM